MEDSLDRTLPLVLEERTVVTRTVGGREFLLAHSSMLDVTKRAISRTHKFLTLDGLIDFSKREGKQTNSAIFFDDKQVVLVLDEEWNENKSTFTIEKSKALKRWILQDPTNTAGMFTQEKLIDFLECWPEEIVGIYPEGDEATASVQSVIKSLITLEMAVKISYDKTAKDQNNTKLVFLVEETDSEGGAKAALPKNWKINIPVLEGADPEELQIRLCYKVPRDEKQVPLFYFECPKLQYHIDQGVDKIGTKLSEALESWMVYKGQP